jgi:O-antigen ligase
LAITAGHISRFQYTLFYVFGAISLLAVLLGFVFEQKALMAIPLVITAAYVGVTNFRLLYFVLLFSLPLAIEYDVTDSLGTDLPSEPLMAGLMLVVFAYLAKNIRSVDFSFFRNSVMLLLIIHFLWILLTTITSLVPVLSIKFVLAKTWYLAAFLLATALILRSEKDLKTAFWCLFIPLFVTVIIGMARHAQMGFAFDKINHSLQPFYRNHVTYAAILVMVIPYVYFARNWYEKGSATRKLLNFSFVLFVVAVYFSYTRACYLALAAMFGAYFIVKYRLMKPAIPAAFAVVIGVLFFITKENYYLKYSPTTKTVSQHEFSDLIDATFKAEDVSSMERVYRWIAAVHMAADRPITGFGPNGFVPNYKNYTVFIFETWISENEEQSGVHNYFLMLLVEQGIPGLVIFLLLLVAFFLMGEKLYLRHHNKPVGFLIMAVILSNVALVVNLVFSDMIEVDKTGSLFFINLTLLVLAGRNFKSLIPDK